MVDVAVASGGAETDGFSFTWDRPRPAGGPGLDACLIYIVESAVCFGPSGASFR